MDHDQEQGLETYTLYTVCYADCLSNEKRAGRKDRCSPALFFFAWADEFCGSDYASSSTNQEQQQGKQKLYAFVQMFELRFLPIIQDVHEIYACTLMVK